MGVLGGGAGLGGGDPAPVGSGVTSVNGDTGPAVVLDAADVGADPAGTASSAVAAHVALPDPHTQYTTTAEAAAAAPVQSVNTQVGAVVLGAASVGADPTGTASAAVSAHVIADPAHAASVVSVAANSLTGTRVQTQLNNAGTRIVALESAAIGANLLKWGFAARIVGEEFGPAGSAGESGATATTSGAGSWITANTALALNDYIIGVSRMTSGTGSTGTATLSWATNTFNFTPRDFGDILVFTIVRMSALLVTNEISFGLGATFTAGATASAGLIARCIGNDNWVLDYRAAGISQASSASTTPLSTALIPRVVGILLTSSGASLYETALPTVPSAQGLVRSPAYIAATLLATPSIASLTNVQLAATPPGQIGGFVRIRNSGATASTNLDCAAFYQLAA